MARRVLAAVALGCACLVPLVAQGPPPPAPRDPVTFTRDIAPLVFERCAGCHRPDGPAPFSLLTYEAVRTRATQIAAVTRSRYMPPWKTEPGYGEFIGQRHLTDQEIARIQRWIDDGRLEGDRRHMPPPPPPRGEWQLGTPDLVVSMPQPYTLAADGPDVFRTFVLSLPIGRTQYVRALEFRPGNPRVVHHANIRIDRTSASRDLDGDDDAEPGYEGVMAHSAVFPDGHFLAWAPGQVSPALPRGLAWRLDPGTDLVFQLHLQPSGKPEPVQVSIGLYFGGEPPERLPLIVRLGRQDIDIPAGARQHVIEDSYTIPVDVEVHAVQPHAHTLAREVRGVATLPDGSTRWLVYIRDWDFRWQHVYRYVEPFTLPKGTVLSMRYTYDNSAENPRNPVSPPGRVQYGWQTGDEMGEMYIQVLTRTEDDRAVLHRSFQQKAMADDLAGYEGLIARGAPNAAALHDDAAFLYLELRRYDEAVRHFEAATRVPPRAPFAFFNLATALMLAGRVSEAIPHYQEAVRLNPDYAVAHNNLGRALEQAGRPEEAVRHYREAVRAAPRLAAAHNNLGLALIRRGELDEATARLEEALRLDPGAADAHYNLGHALRARGDLAGAATHFREAIRLNPGEQAFREALAGVESSRP